MATLARLQAKTADGRAVESNPQEAVVYAGSTHAIEVFGRSHSGWRLLQRVASCHPSCLLIDAARRRLFVANAIGQYQGLSTGSVESYLLDADGKLTLVNRQALGMSATFPTGLALTADGLHLIVAAYGGGAVNLMPVSTDGEVGRVKQAIKEIGSGPHPEKQKTAHPHSITAHPAGQLFLVSDFGSDRLLTFTCREGLLRRSGVTKLSAGSGPSHLALHPGSNLVSVVHELSGELATYSFDQVSGDVSHVSTRKTPALITSLRVSQDGVEPLSGPRLPIARLYA